MRPTISVVIPAHNASLYLADTLASIQRQTVSATVVMVVDDGSSDDTARIALSFGAKVVRQERSGVSAARNAAIAMIETDFVAFCDADDIWQPTKLERQLEALLANPHCDFAFCDYFQFKDEKLLNKSVLREVFEITTDDWTPIAGSAYLCNRETLNQQTLRRSFILPSTFFLRTALLRSLPGFCTVIGETDEDTEFLLRLFVRSDAIFVDEPLMGYRVHAHNATADPRKQRLGLLRLAAHVIINHQDYRLESAKYYRIMLPTYFFRTGRIYVSVGDTDMGIWFLERSIEIKPSLETLVWRIIAPIFRFKHIRQIVARRRVR